MGNLREAGRERGRKAGAGALASGIVDRMTREFIALRQLYPTLGDIDVAATIRAYDRERLACEPDYGQYPELTGLIDRHVGEREGFLEASGLDETAAAFHYSWWFYMTRRVGAHHLARYDLLPPPINCTNVFFPDGRDGVTISDNRDDWTRPEYQQTIPSFRPEGTVSGGPLGWIQGGVSSAMLFDEEPACCFPFDPYELIPDECLDDIQAIVEFMTRYREFYGPGNLIFCDRQLRAVAVEKTNCRVAFRWPEVNGAICITACSYLDPALNAFKQAGTRKAMAIKGETEENSLDWQYFEGADRRQRRLISLTNAEAKAGATLWGAFNIVADTAVPFPDRICLAGEKAFPDREPTANWTLTQHAAVVTGPHRRCLFRSLQDVLHPQSITSYTPKLLLGSGVEMQPAWQDDLDAGRCKLAPAAVATGDH